jgi:hypothetical protein
LPGLAERGGRTIFNAKPTVAADVLIEWNVIIYDDLRTKAPVSGAEHILSRYFAAGIDASGA